MDIGHKKKHFYGHYLSLIQVGQLSVAGKVIVNLLGLSLHRKSMATLNDLLDMTIVVDWYVNPYKKATEFEISRECSTY